MLGAGVQESVFLLSSFSDKWALRPFLSFARGLPISALFNRNITGSVFVRRRRVASHGRFIQSIRSPDIVDLEYADLNLKENISREVGHVRIRQHVNPLSSFFMVPAQVPYWKEVFEDPTLPLMVDIGSGSGRFLIWLAKMLPESKNYLGLDIRHKLMKRAQFWVKEMGLKNIHFMFANAMVSFEQLVSTYPGPLMLVSILVFIQSDVLEVALDMRNQIDALAYAFQHMDSLNSNILCDPEGWVLSNPLGIRTEREIHAELEGAKIYRRIYQKI